jgi:hypothetical protein
MKPHSPAAPVRCSAIMSALSVGCTSEPGYLALSQSTLHVKRAVGTAEEVVSVTSTNHGDHAVQILSVQTSDCRDGIYQGVG